MTSPLIVRDPDNGAVVGELPLAQPDDVESALALAQSCFRQDTWPAYRRAAILEKASELVEVRAEVFATMIAKEGIKTIREARREVHRCTETLKLCAAMAKQSDGKVIPFDQVAAGSSRLGFYERRPAGVVVGITPYNDPLNLVAHKVGPAIASGCPIIIKPHPQTPYSALMLRDAFLEAGLPKPHFQVLIGGVAAAAQLVADKRPRIISFTGGKVGGAAVASNAGMKRLALELGGVGVVAVAADADIEEAAAAIHSGAFWAAGQNCVHAQRIIADKKIYAELRDRLLALATTLKLGPKLSEETDMGPCVDEASAQRLERSCNSAVAAGAVLATGGQREGTRLSPTWLIDVASENPVLREELFGPVSTLEAAADFADILQRVRTAEDAIQAALFTPAISEARQFWKVAPVGAVLINDSTDFRIDAMPFGGIGSAGLGREGVSDAIETFTEKRMMIIAA
jgi:glyceraldehyde-3-phosphate dehydrogenase (NADP+)